MDDNEWWDKYAHQPTDEEVGRAPDIPPRDELAHALAKRLAVVGYHGEKMYERDTRHFLRMADECIRQMEWARRKTITPGWTMELGTIPRKIVINQLDDLTAAPDDWKSE